MGTKIHGKAHDISIGGTDICVDSTSITQTRDAAEGTTNCDADKVFTAGMEGHSLSTGGPLEFGTGSTEATLAADLAAGAASAWSFDPDGTGTASATNPILSGSQIITSLAITAGIGGNITYSASHQGTGVVTRTV